MASQSSQTARRYVLTASFAAVTATGAWYGAGLKTRQEFKQELRAAQETPLEDKIAQLESKKARLVAHRDELESKIQRLTAASTANDSSATTDRSRDAQQASG